mgnify:CR=1 FL=1
MRIQETVDVDEFIKLIGRRKYRRHFGSRGSVSVVEALELLVKEGVEELCSRRLSKLLGVKASTLRTWMMEGKISGRIVKGKYYYNLDSILKLLRHPGDVVLGGKRYKLVAIVPSSRPLYSGGDVEENPEVVEEVLKLGVETGVEVSLES